ncbi:outer membrane biogenesis protein BamB [Symmachiella dynata]|uniref:Outer membrane biogenesis protein BamB n=1 Tax=Symmachiella dynata TaxID=2527995 RepID=A0A517ZNQ5_9PLAN|nr:PQQ-binding-like beta-propeller repeat protein [Symmachiella dynata]QDU44091.1 outer membrane biogenesis protein BamB [Symmachiella dynata]
MDQADENRAESGRVPVTDEPSAEVAQTENVDVPGRPKGFRWWPAVAILGIATVVESILWWSMSENRPNQSVSMWLTTITVSFLLLMWWMFASRLRWRTRFVGLGVMILLGIAARYSVRVEEYSGAVFPILAFRWTPTAEEIAAEYREAHSESGQDEKSVPIEEVVPAEGDVTIFRGADRTGRIVDAGIRTNWDEQPPREIWRHPVGLGWSSFIVVDGLAFTQEQREENETVVCYNAETGDEIWAHTDSVRFSEVLGSDGPRATPTYFDGRLYTQGATGILNCLDARTGESIWATNILEDAGAKVLSWGMSGSPLVYDDVVVVNAGGDDAGLIAYHRLTGDRVWSAGNGPASYSSPRLANILGEQQLLIFNGNGLSGHDPTTGEELWNFPWTTGPKVNAVLPYPLDESRILISTGYGLGAALLEVKHEGDQWSAEQVWKSIRLKAKFNDFVVKDDYVYGLDEGVLTCLDLKTGKRVWKAGRYGYGQILLVDDLLLIITESGEVLLVKAEPKKSQPLARFQAIGGKTWNHATLVRGRLFVRNAREAACYDISK